MPFPWCEDFSFQLDEIFTRLRIINKEKTRGTLSDEITNMTAIFKAHEGCQKPRTVLIEGDPGMGKTTYCQKLAYDWANRREEWDESFPEIELLLLLRCHDIKTNIWEAISEQILPEDIDKESKENFFKFIRENQSRVLLVLDGLDEAEPSKQDMYRKVAESREFSKCHIVFTSRHEGGHKFRRFCNTLWEIVGFTLQDAESFIFKYFKNNRPLAHKLLKQLSPRSGSRDLREMISNPLNTALLCVLCEDFKGVFPTSRTQLYIEIVLCVLRRYENKNDLPTNSENIMNVYKEELIQLGHMALKSLREGELYIEESECGCRSSVVTKFGFLSVQAAGSRRKPCVRYGFLHKSFQEFFSGFYLASKILSGELDCYTVVTDEKYLDELKEAILFMSGIVASQSEESAVCLVKSIAASINCLSRCTTKSEHCINNIINVTFDCIKECATNNKKLQSQLVRTFGSHLELETFQFKNVFPSHIRYFSGSLAVNTTFTNLDLSCHEIDDSDSDSPSDAIEDNSTTSYSGLNTNEPIGDSGARFLSDAIKVNNTLTNLDLSGNAIGDSGAGFLSEAIKVNTVLTNLNLSVNEIGASGAGSLSDAIKVNRTLTNLDLSVNKIGTTGATYLSDAIKVNTVLTNLDLRVNKIGDSGAGSLSDGLKVNTTLTNLDLRDNEIGDSGAVFLSDAFKVNNAMTNLNLSVNKIGLSGIGFFSDAIKFNTSLTNLDLSVNEICPSCAAYLSDAIKVNTALTNLDLSVNRIHAFGADSISDAIKVNATLTNLDLSGNKIGDSGAGPLSDAIKVNRTLTNLDLSGNEIGDSGAGFLSDAIKFNSSLTNLNLSWNEIGDSGAASLSDGIKVNTTLTNLNLRNNIIGDSGAGFLSDAMEVNTTLIDLNLRENRVS